MAQIITLDGQLAATVSDRSMAEVLLERAFPEHYPFREYNFQIGNEWFFKMSRCPSYRLVSVYDVDDTRDVFMLCHADGWITKVSNSFADMQIEGRKIALRGAKRWGVPEGWMIRRLRDNIQLVVTK